MADDRHLNPQRTIRPDPADLWERLDEVRGNGSCSRVISDLIARYLDGRPMPPLPWRDEKPGQDGHDSEG
jgi:hypothetical protein